MRLLIVLPLMMFLSISSALAIDEPIVFPREGQDRAQLEDDKVLCQNWAEEETGVNPKLLEYKISENKEKIVPEEEGEFKGLFKGIFKGAATGAVTGTIEKNVGNEVGSDALKGAVLGGIFKREKQNDRKDELEYRTGSLEREDLKEEYSKYLRAYSVCLEAKGYSVK